MTVDAPSTPPRSWLMALYHRGRELIKGRLRTARQGIDPERPPRSPVAGTYVFSARAV